MKSTIQTKQLDLSAVGNRVVFPVIDYNRATLQVDGASASVTGVFSFQRGNNGNGFFYDFPTPASITAIGFYPATSAYDLGAVAFVAAIVTTAQSGVSLTLTLVADDGE